jgi:hypothetical protein
MKSILIRIAALVAFIAINIIGFKAFSAEAAEKTSLEEQMQTAEIRSAAAAQSLESQKALLISNSKSDLAVIPACQLASEGLVENKWKNIRIQINGAVVAGAETLTELGLQLKSMVVEHKCIPLAVPCSFASEGLALGSWAKHRVMVQDVIAFGGNNTNRLFEQISELKKIGVCQ